MWGGRGEKQKKGEGEKRNTLKFSKPANIMKRMIKAFIVRCNGQICVRCLLAQNDSILQAFLEVGADGSAGYVFDPDPQLFLFLRVILLCDLVGQRGQRSHVFHRQQ